MIKSIMPKSYNALKHLILDLKIKWAAGRSPLKVIIGASGTSQPGWIKTNVAHLNILHERDWARYFEENSIDIILAEHVLEHLTVEEGVIAARNCFHYLKHGGYFRIAVPDGNFPDPKYLDQVKPSGSGPGADDHKTLYNCRTLSDLFASCGFKVTLLEFWDEQGKFHYAPWSAEGGMVHRSRWHDPRNNEQEIAYTSLVLDAKKP